MIKARIGRTVPAGRPSGGRMTGSGIIILRTRKRFPVQRSDKRPACRLVLIDKRAACRQDDGAIKTQPINAGRSRNPARQYGKEVQMQIPSIRTRRDMETATEL